MPLVNAFKKCSRTSGIFERQVFDHQLDTTVLLDKFERVVNEREGSETEEVHLEKPKLLETIHVVLCDDFLFVGAVKRDQLLQRMWRDDDAGGVHAGIARHAFELARRHPAPA